MVTAAFAVGTAFLLDQRIRQYAMADLQAEALGTARSRVLTRLNPQGLDQPMRGEVYAQFDAFVKQSIRSERTARVKLWAPDGTVVYSDNADIVGQRFPDNQSVKLALEGQTTTHIEVPEEPENEAEQALGTLVEVYTPLVFPGETAPRAVLEIYQYYAPTAARIASLQAWTYGAIGLGALLLYATLVTIVAGGRRTIDLQRASLSEANRRLQAANEDLDSAQGRLRLILNTAGEGILEVDREGVIKFANPVAAGMLGWDVEELVGAPHRRILHAQSPPSACPVCATLDDGQTYRAEHLSLRRKDGSHFQAEYTSSPILKAAELNGAVVILSDITERKQAERELRESQRTLSTLMSNLPGMAYRCRNDRRWTMEFVSQGCYDLTGYAPDDLVGNRSAAFGDLVHPEDRQAVWSQVQAAVRAGMPFRVTYRIITAQGEQKWVWEQGRAVEDPHSEMVLEGFITDITERVRLEAQLQHDAFHDALTSLPNRALFMDRLHRALERAKRRSDYKFAVLSLDLDRFKLVNDGLGHTEGDKLLVAAGQRLAGRVRQVDTVARLGGDEFGLILDDVEDLGFVTRVANRILRDLEAPFDLNGEEIHISASIGVAYSATGYARAGDLLRDADLAMYRAKSAGKARYSLFDTAMHERAMGQLRLETDLRRGIENQELELHYQPIVRLEDGTLASFEALVRWNHAERGLLLPGEFLPTAYESGLILPLGKWVLEAACRQIAAWRQLHPEVEAIRVSVNLSDQQFSGEDLLGEVKRAVEAACIPAEALELEVTETVIMEEAENPEAILASLQGFGVGLQIDDFGTGYSSLGALHRFRFTSLKIDRSFIRGLCDDCGDDHIVRTILLLAENLNMQAIAEGVEDAEQARLLRHMGCPLVQGYFFCHPLPAVEAGRLLAQQTPFKQALAQLT